MRIAIVGYGKMGRIIKSLAPECGIEISAIIDPAAEEKEITSGTLSREALDTADAAVDFSSPSAVAENIRIYAENGIPAVIGTTGWLDLLPEIRKTVCCNNARLIYSGNFSIGVALFLKLVERAGELINPLSSFDISINEIHHREKKDAPSGTALMAAEKVLRTVDRKKGLQFGISGNTEEKNLLNITSERVGYIPGIHTITIDSPADTIEIRHTARTREGFADGALKAALWLIRQAPGLYTMDDFISDSIGGRNA